MAYLESELTIQVKLQSHLVILFHIFTSWLLQGTDFLIGFRCEKSFDFFFFNGQWLETRGEEGSQYGVHLCFFVYK